MNLPKKVGRAAKYCGESCKYRYFTAIKRAAALDFRDRTYGECLYDGCKVRFKRQRPGSLRQRFCSKVCAGKYRYVPKPPVPKPCLHCGTTFQQASAHARFCSKRCNSKYHYNPERERQRNAARGRVTA
jgi:predicted nucleic acid-binding Zn ribbon protein